MEQVVGAKAYAKWLRYRDAYDAKSRWTAEEKDAKAELLLALGYDPEDEKPPSAVFVDGAGEPVCEVKVGKRKGLDLKYLREKHPSVYAECEKWTHPISIRNVE